MAKPQKKYRIRKLTPSECLRLMGVSEINIKKMTSCGVSDAQLYKATGNSITTNPMWQMFYNLLIDRGAVGHHEERALFCDVQTEIYNKDNPLRVFESFAGYGSQSMALDIIKQKCPEFHYNIVGISEIDKYAIQLYNAVHGETKNYGDISKIDWDSVPDFDFFTMSSPCQDFSVAGMQKGGAEGSGTRSSLLWECRKAILAKKPKYIFFENVEALACNKFRPYFLKWQNELANYGYNNFATILDTADYGIPQHRERLYMISIRDDGENPQYNFPKPFKLTTFLEDLLDKEKVAEKYYIKEERTNKLNLEKLWQDQHKEID